MINEIIINPSDLVHKFLSNKPISKSDMNFIVPNEIDEDSISLLFELLITIFAMMVSEITVIMNKMNKVEIINEYDFDKYINYIKQKFNLLNIILTCSSYDNSHEVFDLLNSKYCKILLRFNKLDANEFIKYDIPEKNIYYFILNKNFTQKSTLSDIYAIIVLENKIYKISFKLIDIQSLI